MNKNFEDNFEKEMRFSSSYDQLINK